MIVLLNPAAGGSTALQKWERINREFISPGFRIYTPNCPLETQTVVRRALGRGETDFIAAGGDGTINVLLNSLLNMANRQQIRKIRLGTIGIGSSNDFHKPFSPGNLIQGIPCHINTSRVRRRDIGCLTYKNGAGMMSRYFLINASIGVTAEANYFFNHPHSGLRILKRWHTASAILYAAISRIIVYRNFEVRLASPETGNFSTKLTNIGVLKSPHFSGNLRYHTPAAYDNGRLAVHLYHDMSKRELFRCLWALDHHRPYRTPKTCQWETSSLNISAQQPFVVEYDGEIITTTSVCFTVLPKYIKVCS